MAESLIATTSSTFTGNIVNNSSVSGPTCTATFQDADPGAPVDFEAKSWTCTGQSFNLFKATSTSEIQHFNAIYFPLYIIIVLMIIHLVFIVLQWRNPWKDHAN